MTDTNIQINKSVPVPPKIPEPGKPDFSGKVKSLFSGIFSDSVRKLNKNISGKSDEKKQAYEGQQTEKLYNVTDLTSNLTPRKILKLSGIFVMFLMIVGAVYVRYVRKTPVRNISTIVNIPTPTYSPYQKYKPSIYAEDPNFKKIDEGISVLENEVKNTTLEERSLLPPGLDFDVVFK